MVCCGCSARGGFGRSSLVSIGARCGGPRPTAGPLLGVGLVSHLFSAPRFSGTFHVKHAAESIRRRRLSGLWSAGCSKAEDRMTPSRDRRAVILPDSVVVVEGRDAGSNLGTLGVEMSERMVGHSHGARTWGAGWSTTIAAPRSSF